MLPREEPSAERSTPRSGNQVANLQLARGVVIGTSGPHTSSVLFFCELLASLKWLRLSATTGLRVGRSLAHPNRLRVENQT